jgi:glutathione reductase (NADPH)
MTADIVVNGAGRVAAIDDLELDKAGVETSRKGISVNASMQTTQPHIFAIGDCAETLQLARVADYEALVAADTIVNKNPAEAFSKMAPAAVPAHAVHLPPICNAWAHGRVP